MSLFEKEGGHETAETVETQLKPFVVRTQNVAKELLQAAANYKVPVTTLDFHLHGIQSFSKITEEGSADDWSELSPTEIRDLKSDDFLNPKLLFRQIYEIEIFSHADAEPSPLDKIDLSIGGNPTLCKIYLTVKAGSVATHYETFEEDFLALVHKKMLRANLMIGLFDSMMTQNFQELFAKVRIDKKFVFKSAERFLIAEGYEPVETINDRLITHYENKQGHEDEHGRVDYSKRGYILSAVENELLIEYVKPKKGEIGRNCRGELIIPAEPVVRYEPTFTVGELIEVIDNPNNIEYRAKKGGYVTYEGGVYNINTEVEVTEISFKTTGSIDTQLDADVAITVREKDPLKDAIGTGTEVTVNIINIDGNIGPNAKVTARKARVEGQVHQSATITADDLSINILKGNAFGKNVSITRLEHGTVEAENVTIVQATGGKIRAKEVTLEILGSHVKITASRKIEISKLQGGENLLIIDPLVEETREESSDETHKMDEVKHSMGEIQKELAGFEKTARDNAGAMEELKKKLAYYKSNGIKLPTAFVQKYQQFQQFKEKLDALRSELKQKEDQYAFLTQKQTELQNQIFDARVINHDRWRNHNEIIFKLIKPEIELVHVPIDNSDEAVLGVVETEDGEFVIKVLEQ